MKLIAVIAAGLLLTGCSSTAPATTSDEESKYTQTWTKGYAETTCSDWNDSMTDKQQFAAAADILSAARDKLDGATGVAPDDLIVAFAADITTACVIPTETLTDLTYAIYNTGTEYKP